jgi:hypothetical protein
MRRFAIFTAFVGLAIGVIGGMLGGKFWFGIGFLVGSGGVCILWAIAFWTNPAELLRGNAEVESMASGLPPHAGPPRQVQVAQFQASAQQSFAQSNTKGDDQSP